MASSLGEAWTWTAGAPEPITAGVTAVEADSQGRKQRETQEQDYEQCLSSE